MGDFILKCVEGRLVFHYFVEGTKDTDPHLPRPDHYTTIRCNCIEGDSAKEIVLAFDNRIKDCHKIMHGLNRSALAIEDGATEKMNTLRQQLDAAREVVIAAVEYLRNNYYYTEIKPSARIWPIAKAIMEYDAINKKGGG